MAPLPMTFETSHGTGDERALIVDSRQAMRVALSAGASGLVVCQGFSQVYDDIVCRLWEIATQEVPGSESCPLAIVALGGWGRREMCPYSDIDFVILAEPEHQEIAAQLADKMLYPLWDAKIKVGHALRSVHDSLQLAKDDLPSATALLDARLIVGDSEMFTRLQRESRRLVAPGGNANEFVSRLRCERERRHDRFGDSLYLLEPNIKQGIGGLRDFATAHWAVRARWSVSEMRDLLKMGQLTRRQVGVMEEGLDLLLKLRCLVQLHANRSTDQLSFELQESIAPILYPDAEVAPGRVVSAVAPSVEALMRDYYLAGRGIARIAERLLETVTVPELRKPRIANIDRSFLNWNGTLAVRDPQIFRDEPEEMVRYYRVGLQNNIPLYGHTQELIEAQVANAGYNLENNPKAHRYFLEALTDLQDKSQKPLLGQMHAVGILAAVIPEFGPCTGRIQHDLYHVYTVDHHQLFTVALLKKTGRGELAEEAPVATEAYQSLEEVESLYLATLLHDVGKPLGGGHSETGANIAAATALAMGLSSEQVSMVDFLVRQHLTMSHISQRRDLSDPDVIDKFANVVGTTDALSKLFLLTRCDTAMTAPGNLTSWKDQLLSELYLRTRAQLLGAEMKGRQLVHRRLARQRAVEIVSKQGENAMLAERAEAMVEVLEPSFVNSLNARQLARVIDSVILHESEEASVVVLPRCELSRGQTELIVVLRDGPSVLSCVAGVLAAHGVTIDIACITSVGSEFGNVAIEVFFVRDEAGHAIANDDRRWSRIQENVAHAMTVENRNEFLVNLMASRSEDHWHKPNIAHCEDTQVKIFDGESSDFSVVEVHSSDDVGLLYWITSVLSERGLDIHRAMVATEGDRIADVFYLQKQDGSKLTAVEGKELRKALLKALDDRE